MNDQKLIRIERMIGICRKAGRLVLGTEAVLDAVRSGQARLVITASDISENTRKKLSDSCSFYGKTLVCIPLTMAELSKSAGSRSSAAAAAVSDANLAKAIAEMLDDTDTQTAESKQDIPQNTEV